MRAVSFGWTWPAFVAGAKTVTRRDWKTCPFKKGEVVQALDRVFFLKGKRIGTFVVTEQPTFSPLESMPDTDYEAEGFEWFKRHPAAIPKAAKKRPWGACTFEAFDGWRKSGGSLWVLRFLPVEVYPEAKERLKKWVDVTDLPLFGGVQ